MNEKCCTICETSHPSEYYLEDGKIIYGGYDNMYICFERSECRDFFDENACMECNERCEEFITAIKVGKSLLCLDCYDEFRVPKQILCKICNGCKERTDIELVFKDKNVGICFLCINWNKIFI